MKLTRTIQEGETKTRKGADDVKHKDRNYFQHLISSVMFCLNFIFIGTGYSYLVSGFKIKSLGHDTEGDIMSVG